MKIAAFERSKQGTGASRRLRITGRTPGILYGGSGQPQLIELDHNTLWHALKKEAFHASVLSLDINGTEQPALLRDVQMHPYKQLVLHVDFQRVDATTKLHMKVPLHFSGDENSPAVNKQGRGAAGGEHGVKQRLQQIGQPAKGAALNHHQAKAKHQRGQLRAQIAGPEPARKFGGGLGQGRAFNGMAWSSLGRAGAQAAGRGG